MEIYFYNSLVEFSMNSKHNEKIGDIVKTAGFYKLNDSGAATYIVTSNSKPLSDNLVVSREFVYHKFHELRILSENGKGCVEQFGAKGNVDLTGLSDDEKANIYLTNNTAIESALNSGISTIAFSNKTYLISGGISVEKSVNIVGNSASIELVSENSSVFSFDGPNNMLENVSISDINIKGIVGNANNSCTLINAENVAGFKIDNVKFFDANKALDIHKAENAYDNCSNIRIKNCIAENVENGFKFSNVYDFKIQNCRIEMFENGDGIGLNLMNNVGVGTVEDFSASEGYIGVSYSNSLGWSGYAVERILFKNLLISSAVIAIEMVDTDIPVHFANTMIVDSYSGIYISSAKNITMTNSSVQLVAPSEADEYTNPVSIFNFAQAKFIHTQFDFPYNFQSVDFNEDTKITSDLVFVDCTLQKTDITGAEGVTSPSGFGLFGVIGADKIGVTETFDACEFRSYIQNYSAGNMPVVLSVPNNSDSKLIIKNCRFVNENSCTVPYFKLDDSAKFDNIVVYNCFFENYNYTDSNASSVYPIFGRVVNGSITPSNTDENGAKIHNIFARCNMRSSEPTRNSGTTINEMKEYL